MSKKKSISLDDPAAALQAVNAELAETRMALALKRLGGRPKAAAKALELTGLLGSLPSEAECDRRLRDLGPQQQYALGIRQLW